MLTSVPLYLYLTSNYQIVFIFIDANIFFSVYLSLDFFLMCFLNIATLNTPENKQIPIFKTVLHIHYAPSDHVRTSRCDSVAQEVTVRFPHQKNISVPQSLQMWHLALF